MHKEASALDASIFIQCRGRGYKPCDLDSFYGVP